MGDDHSACHNTSLGNALSTRCCYVGSIHTSCGLLCIDTSEICFHLLNPQLEPQYDGKYNAPLNAVVNLIYTLHDNS
jgi:hypothetical protein